MNNEFYMSYIEERLSVLQHRIMLRSSLNVLNLNVRAEDFYKELFNLLYHYDLINANLIKQNADSIDLIDEEKKIIIQVTSTSSKQKIESTLKKNVMKEKYKEFSLYFIFIGKEDESLKGKTYNNPYHINFDSKTNIYTVADILKKINSLDIDEMRKTYDLVCKYLKFPEVSPRRVTSLMPSVIKSLCKTDLDKAFKNQTDLKAYEIERKIVFNHLTNSSLIIKEFAPYEFVMSKIYEEFDKLGKLKSYALLTKIRRIYQTYASQLQNEDDIFFSIIQKLVEEMAQEVDLIEANISEEELEICIEIIVVDSFIRCNIFKKPEGGSL